MANSMTGFGHGEAVVNGKKLTCDVKSVNNRYLDVQVRMPRSISGLEPTVRDLARRYLNRGKLDFSIFIEDCGEDSKRVYCDFALAEAYKVALEELGAVMGRPYLVKVPDLIAFPGVLQAETAEGDGSEWLDVLTESVEMALNALCDMRAQEGAGLEADILERCTRLEILHSRVASRAPLVVDAYREKLQSRIVELLGMDADKYVEPQRMAAEMLLFADKAAIDEELVRLHSHFKALRKTVSLSEPVGKKLDFLIQEINREVNTIGSKANDLDITNTVMDMKSEVEKIREQIQNLE